jgi:hypothetical protein
LGPLCFSVVHQNAAHHAGCTEEPFDCASQLVAGLYRLR